MGLDSCRNRGSTRLLLAFVAREATIDTMKYRLRTLVILMAVLPPLLAGGWLVWERQAAMSQQRLIEQQQRLVEERQRRMKLLNGLNAQLADLQASQNAGVLQLQQLRRELDLQKLKQEFDEANQDYFDKSRARIAELQASQIARLLELQKLRPGMDLRQLMREYDEKDQQNFNELQQLLLLQKLRNGSPDRPQAAPGIYFLGPEFARSTELHY